MTQPVAREVQGTAHRHTKTMHNCPPTARCNNHSPFRSVPIATHRVSSARCQLHTCAERHRASSRAGSAQAQASIENTATTPTIKHRILLNISILYLPLPLNPLCNCPASGLPSPTHLDQSP